MDILYWIILATFFDSLAALVGIFSIWMSDKSLKKILLIFVAFSAGALLSGSFFHLMSESLKKLSTTKAFLFLTIGFILFFLIEKIFFWHHCHEGGECDVHPFTYLILIGDGIHNFIDGLIIAASFIVDINLGIITTLIIVSHEIPQELGNFGVLVYGGFSKMKALSFNLLAQLTCILGGLAGFFLTKQTEFTTSLLPFAAGGFIYISASDLIPELHKEADLKKSLMSFTFFLLGFLLTLALKFLFEH